MSKTMRFQTLARDYGPLKRATECDDAEWQRVMAERRFMTIYHAENDWCTPIRGLVGHHGCVNTILKLVFARPVPPDVSDIVGMRNSQEAFNLCNT